MLNAILNSKSGRLHADSGEKISWRKLFRENEDLVTATVIERFSYMNPAEVWRILSSAAKGQLPRYRVAEITKIEFWPLWPHEERQKGVEPDVFIEFSLGDPARLVHVIVEAKHGAHQLHNQLMVEIESWYQSLAEADSHLPEQIYILALGGSSGHIDPAKFHRSVRTKMPLVPFSGLVSIGWDELAKAVSEARATALQEGRILADIEESLALFGYRHRTVPRQLEALEPMQEPDATLGVLTKSNTTFN